MNIKNIVCLSPVLSKSKKHKYWELQEDWMISIETEKDGVIRLEISKGFIFDLASVPRILQSILDTGANEWKILVAALVHDSLYSYQKITKEFADNLFYGILKFYGYRNAKLYYYAVKWFGGKAYNGHENDPQGSLVKFWWEDK